MADADWPRDKRSLILFHHQQLSILLETTDRCPRRSFLPGVNRLIQVKGDKQDLFSCSVVLEDCISVRHVRNHPEHR